MSFQQFRAPLGPLLADPAINLLRLAAATATPGGELDAETLKTMRQLVDAGALSGLPGRDAWPELARGLMMEAPSRMLRALRDCGALTQLLPEFEALFGIPQSADDPPEVDIGEHQLRVLDEAARCNAPLAVRFAALVFNFGKSDSPREHLPAHYRHIERGAPRIAAVAERFGVPAEFLDLALLALTECERIHRAAEMRAGSIAALLERVDAYRRPQRFADLLQLCGCDFRAYPGRATALYPKARLLDTALAASTGITALSVASNADGEGQVAVAVLEARARAIATVLRSARWTAQEDLAA
jgi:tRNA nucleotidyltransferase (CCA-adding enzyme)